MKKIIGALSALAFAVDNRLNRVGYGKGFLIDI